MTTFYAIQISDAMKELLTRKDHFAVHVYTIDNTIQNMVLKAVKE